jgi:hypothetical protein
MIIITVCNHLYQLIMTTLYPFVFVGKIISDFSECFSDLDEITARYIQPMNDYVQEIGKSILCCMALHRIVLY